MDKDRTVESDLRVRIGYDEFGFVEIAVLEADWQKSHYVGSPAARSVWCAFDELELVDETAQG